MSDPLLLEAKILNGTFGYLSIAHGTVLCEQPSKLVPGSLVPTCIKGAAVLCTASGLNVTASGLNVGDHVHFEVNIGCSRGGRVERWLRGYAFIKQIRRRVDDITVDWLGVCLMPRITPEEKPVPTLKRVTHAEIKNYGLYLVTDGCGCWGVGNIRVEKDRPDCRYGVAATWFLPAGSPPSHIDTTGQFGEKPLPPDAIVYEIVE